MFKKLYKKVILKIVLKVKIFHYFLISEDYFVQGKPHKIQPLLIQGKGCVIFGNNVCFGVPNAPLFYNSYSFINPRTANSKIIFGNDISINNNFSIISESSGIYIGDKTIIGLNVSIMDTDFHHIDPNKRFAPGYLTSKINIGKNVWIGNNVTILKGVEIGSNSIIANGSLVNRNIPENVIAGGIPAKILRKIEINPK